MTGAIVREERIGGQRLIQGDCLEVMPLLGKVDAVVTDPPYGMGDLLRKGGKDRWSVTMTKGTSWDDTPADVSWIPALNVPAVVWGGQFFELPAQRGWLVWDKLMEDFSTSVCELAWTNMPRPVKRFRYASGMVQQEGRVHPTQKPVALMKWCLGFLPDARTILDPFMGSGTTLVACQRMGRQGIGIELDPDYFDIACRRVDEAARQPDLLIPQTQPAQEPADLFRETS